MVDRMDNKLQQIPKRFWEDLKWARRNHSNFLRTYRDQWVAIVNKTLICAGDNLEEIEKSAREATGEEFIVTFFVDGGEHIYAY